MAKKQNQEKFLAALEKIGGRGLGLAAKNVGLHINTVSVWMKDQAFFDIVQEIRNRCNQRVEDKLYAMAMKGNFGAVCKWLDNRMPENWQDRRNISIKHETPTMVDLVEQIKNNGNGKKPNVKSLEVINADVRTTSGS